MINKYIITGYDTSVTPGTVMLVGGRHLCLRLTESKIEKRAKRRREAEPTTVG